MANPVRKMRPMMVKPKVWSPFRRGWRWNRTEGKYERTWVTNYRHVYIKNVDGKVSIRLGPEHGYRKLMTTSERAQVVRWCRRRQWDYKVGAEVEVHQYPFLRGDVDMKPDLCQRLNDVGREVGEIFHVNSGCRTYEEQAALYRQNMYPNGTRRPGRPLTARPGTSNHEGCNAADLSRPNGLPIGSSAKIRAAMKRRGLGLPVPGEPWHVEISSSWRGAP